MSETHPTTASNDAEIYDADTLADLSDLFGKERLATLLSGLDDEIVQRLETATAEDTSLGANAHALVSVSGVLGFFRLSKACARLEQACLDGAERGIPLQTAQSEAARARPAIARLRALDV